MITKTLSFRSIGRLDEFIEQSNEIVGRRFFTRAFVDRRIRQTLSDRRAGRFAQTDQLQTTPSEWRERRTTNVRFYHRSMRRQVEVQLFTGANDTFEATRTEETEKIRSLENIFSDDEGEVTRFSTPSL